MDNGTDSEFRCLRLQEVLQLDINLLTGRTIYDSCDLRRNDFGEWRSRFDENSIFITVGTDPVSVFIELSELTTLSSGLTLMCVRYIYNDGESGAEVELETALDYAASVIHLAGSRLGISIDFVEEGTLSNVLSALGWREWIGPGGTHYLFAPENQHERPVSRLVQPTPGYMADFECDGDYRLREPKRISVSAESGWTPAGRESESAVNHRERQRVADKKFEDRHPVANLVRTRQAAKVEEVASPDSGVDESWIEVPSPGSTVHDHVWHYTDASGIIGILRSSALWATNVECLNDSAELDHGFSIIDAVMSRIYSSRYISKTQKTYLQMVIEAARSERVRDNLFVFCASEEMDSLSQWRGYGGGPGYAIAIKSSEAPLISAKVDTISDHLTPLSSWLKVVYSLSDQEQLAEEALGFIGYRSPRSLEDGPSLQFLVEEDAMYLTGIAACLKHPAFRDEQEVRVLLDAREVGSSVEFRPGRYGVTPYVQAVYGDVVATNGGAPVGVASRGCLPVERVMVGPASHPEAAVRGLRVLLNSLGMDIDVDTSSAPFRV